METSSTSAQKQHPTAISRVCVNGNMKTQEVQVGFNYFRNGATTIMKSFHNTALATPKTDTYRDAG